jgi:hypothetical protein
MKTTILIKGQLNGNFKLRNSIECDNVEKLPFNNYSLKFNTKKEAKKALREAYKYMKANDYDVELIRGESLMYDASSACIVDRIVR